MTRVGEHAVVLGASLAGLAAAAALAERFDRVTIVERDTLPQSGNAAGHPPRTARPHLAARRTVACPICSLGSLRICGRETPA